MTTRCEMVAAADKQARAQARDDEVVVADRGVAARWTVCVPAGR